MTRSLRAVLLALAAATLGVSARPLRAQDTTFRGITLNGVYDPTAKVSIAILPVGGAFGDSVRAIVQRDLDWSDRFNIVAIEGTDPRAFRAPGAAAGLNYPLFVHLNVAAVVDITPVASGLHIAMHDVARAQVVNVTERSLPPNALGRDWRLALHQTSDEIQRWITGQRGIAATRIAYLRGQAIRLVDSDGADEVTVPTDKNGFSPAWNPAGTMLVYHTYGDVASRLVLLDLATARSRTLATAPRNVQYITPVFTPDGNSIVFARSGEDGSDLYIIGAGGGDAPRRLTVGRGVQNASPTVSPDGRRIVYVSNALGRPELYIMDADGTGSDVLTNYDFSEKNYRSDPDWSPDGRLIAYQERINDRFQIRTIRVTGGTPKLLTSEGENEQPSWAPDARHLVFTSSRTGVRQLWIMDTESGRMRQLTKSAGSRLAAWSPRLGLPAQ
jgi:TolB protein